MHPLSRDPSGSAKTRRMAHQAHPLKSVKPMQTL